MKKVILIAIEVRDKEQLEEVLIDILATYDFKKERDYCNSESQEGDYEYDTVKLSDDPVRLSRAINAYYKR